MVNSVEEIKDRLAIEDLVGQYVQLKKVGRSFKGLCPFHTEKTPSFIVSPERGIAYCFGCNRGGDIFRFIQEIEGVDFSDALKILAEKTGVKLEQHRIQQPKITVDEKDSLIQIYEKTTKFYESQLWSTEKGSKVLEYLRRRGLTDESIKMWRVGYSPDSYEETYQHLLKEGYTKKALVSGGLAMTQETTVEKIYDRFRGRLMFPIFDSLGRVVAFGGRALSKEQEPKYLNSPETPIYHKSNILYGFFQAKPALKNLEEVVIVEGYVDVIASFQEGVTNVVAPCGTALAAKQVRLLKPFVKTLILGFDTDLAGQEAAQRAYELAQEFELHVKTFTLPEGKDPAEFSVTHKGELAGVVKQSVPYTDYFYERLLSTYGTADLSAKRAVLQEFLPFFQQFKSAVEKDEYIRRLAHDLDLKEVQIYDEIKSFKLPVNHPARFHASRDFDEESPQNPKRSAEELLLGLLLEFPRVGKLLATTIAEDFFSEALKPIYKAIAQQYNDHGFDSVGGIIEALPHEIKENAALLSLYVAEKYGEVSEEVAEKEMAALTSHMQKKRLDGLRRDLQKQLMVAEKDGNKDISHDLLKKITELHQN